MIHIVRNREVTQHAANESSTEKSNEERPPNKFLQERSFHAQVDARLSGSGGGGASAEPGGKLFRLGRTTTKGLGASSPVARDSSGFGVELGPAEGFLFRTTTNVPGSAGGVDVDGPASPSLRCMSRPNQLLPTVPFPVSVSSSSHESCH